MACPSQAKTRALEREGDACAKTSPPAPQRSFASAAEFTEAEARGRGYPAGVRDHGAGGRGGRRRWVKHRPQPSPASTLGGGAWAGCGPGSPGWTRTRAMSR